MNPASFVGPWGRLLRRLALLATLLVGAGGAWAQAVTVTFFHNDMAGTPLLATDAGGAVVWKENYLPYGYRQQADAASAGNRLWFMGKPHDPSTGLTYMGARYYMPLLGRFTGMDPKEVVPEQPHSFNRYAYGNNNPYRYVDPDGKIAETVWDAFNLSLGFQSLVGNVRAGNWSGAAIDGVGIAVDAAATALPGIPGGMGAGIAAYRGSALAAKGAAGEARFINGVKVTDRATGNVLQGTVDLKPTLERIAAGKSFPHRNDGSVFGNKEGLLPQQPRGYYTEYVHPTPGVNGPGPQRIVTGQGGEVFYSPDHYGTFIRMNP